jgi:protein phosphatase 2C family protein 2/3
MDIDHRTQNFGGLGGRVIFLGDGTEISSDAADPDSEMFDHDDEDADLDMQVNRGSTEEDADPKFSTERSQREGTPGPTPAPNPETPQTTDESPNTRAHTESPSSIATEPSDQTEETGKEIPETGNISSKSKSKIIPASEGELSTKEQETS